MAIAIKKILLKKGINAAGKSGLGFIFDGRDNSFLLYLFVRLFLFLCQRQEFRIKGKSRILIEYFPLKG